MMLKSLSITIERKSHMATKLSPIHPGEILREEFMRPLGLNANSLAIALHTSAPNLYDLLAEGRRITPDMALRLSRYFGTTPQFWMNMQAHYDIVSNGPLETKIKAQVRPRAAATLATRPVAIHAKRVHAAKVSVKGK
jgi:addiction module HigA family antidote